MPLRVLILREESLCTDLTALLCEAGCEVSFLPVTRTSFVKTQTPQIRNYSWLAFTSANGVRGYYRAMESSAYVLPLDIRLAAVGKTTGQVIHDHFGRTADIVSEAADGKSLAQTLTKSLPAGTDILYPCPGGHDTEFFEICRHGGLNITALPVYETKAIAPDQLRADYETFVAIDTAIFFAPSAVNAFHAAVLAPWNFSVVAIGPATERALVQVGHNNILKSEQPEPHSIAKAVLAVLSMERESLHA